MSQQERRLLSHLHVFLDVFSHIFSDVFSICSFYHIFNYYDVASGENGGNMI